MSKHEESEQELWEESQTRKAEILHKKKSKGEDKKRVRFGVCRR
jgi:hypothetical protein